VGVLLFLCLAPGCLLVIRRRRRDGVPFWLPFAAVALLLAFALWSVPELIRIVRWISLIGDPSSKATLLAAGISVLMNCAAFLIIVVLPVGLGGYFVDRWLIARWKRRRTIG
jgi:hypothetical protein